MKGKCDICGENEVVAWLNQKQVCQRCWNVHKYGDMEMFIERMEFKKKLKGGEKI